MIDHGTEIALGLARCKYCHGRGRRGSWGRTEVTCHCVQRRVCRMVVGRYRRYGREVARVSWSRTERGPVLGYPSLEFRADVELVAKRTLTPAEWDTFRLFHLQGKDWEYCTRKLAIDRGTFFHAVYRIDVKLGAAFAAAGIFPDAVYFYNEIPRGSCTNSNERNAFAKAVNYLMASAPSQPMTSEGVTGKFNALIPKAAAA